jgi:hypothetical protein
MEYLKLRSFLIEFRHRIQSANVFLTFNENLANNTKTKILLKVNEISISIDNQNYKIDINNFFNINIKSICNLIIKNNSISFRFNTNETNFDKELLKLNLQDTVEQPENSISGSKINVICNDKYSLNCSNCKSNLAALDSEDQNSVQFSRILELPSNGLDLNEWFCHKPHSLIVNDNRNSECISNEINDCHRHDAVSNLFKPKNCDLFYSNFYVLFNRDIIDASRVRQKRNYFYCKRCLNFLGEKTSNDSIKMWCENFCFNDQLPFYQNKNVFDNIIHLIKMQIAQSDAFLYLSSIVKIIFEAKVPKNDSQLYLLIQIMDRNLDLYKLNLENFKLEQTKGIKIMYHCIAITPDDKDTDDLKTLNYWKKDMDSVVYEISSNIYHKFCKYLESNSKFIPDFYRKNNLFYLSYIDL